jgi:hypothetical protein
MSEHEQHEEKQTPVEIKPYEHKNPATGSMEESNWSFGGWAEENND